MNQALGKSLMCQHLSVSVLMIREGWSLAFYVGQLPAKYALLDEGLQDLSLHSSVTVLVNESASTWVVIMCD